MFLFTCVRKHAAYYYTFSIIYIHVHVPLNNFVGSSFLMASSVLKGTLSFPVPHSLRRASRFRIHQITFPFRRPFLFWVCPIALAFSRLFLFWVRVIALAYSGLFLFWVSVIALAFSGLFLLWVCQIAFAYSGLFLFWVGVIGCPCRF